MITLCLIAILLIAVLLVVAGAVLVFGLPLIDVLIAVLVIALLAKFIRWLFRDNWKKKGNEES